MDMAPSTPESLTPHVAATTLAFFGFAGGYEPSKWRSALLTAISISDPENLAKFEAGFPGEVAAVKLISHTRGRAILRAIATRTGTVK